MKKLHRVKSVSIPESRWLAYATASLATSVAGAQSAHAEIHYSGPINMRFEAASHYSPVRRRFHLNQPGADFSFVNRLHSSNFAGVAGFSINGPVSGQVAGTFKGDVNYDCVYVSDLKFGDNISTRPFTPNIGHHGPYSDFNFAVLNNQFLYYYVKWFEGELAYVGFKFNTGEGVQYGWARVKIDPTFGGSYKGYFKLIDYAYGDVGDSLTAGQTETASRAHEASIPDQGSLGLLALGGAGLMAWRRSRSRASAREQN